MLLHVVAGCYTFQLYFSSNLGNTWQLIQERVNARFYWGVQDHDPADLIHMEVEDTQTGWDWAANNSTNDLIIVVLTDSYCQTCFQQVFQKLSLIFHSFFHKYRVTDDLQLTAPGSLPANSYS